MEEKVIIDQESSSRDLVVSVPIIVAVLGFIAGTLAFIFPVILILDYLTQSKYLTNLLASRSLVLPYLTTKRRRKTSKSTSDEDSSKSFFIVADIEAPP